MPVAVAIAVANAISQVPQAVSITWHGGEPLVTPIDHFAALVAPFAQLQNQGQIQHIIQSNGTLINRSWCEFFRKHNFHVGISIDGDRVANRRRRTWAGRETFDDMLQGIDLLRQSAIPFSIIAVVGQESLSRAAELYESFLATGCFSVGINIEERLGSTAIGCAAPDECVTRFWVDLFAAWKARPTIQVREFTHVFCWFDTVLDGRPSDPSSLAIDLFPTVSCEGRVTLLSPEFVDATTLGKSGFVVGNILEEDFLTLLDEAEVIGYVRDFAAGCVACKTTCEYYSACGGGTAANKYFELGTTFGTTTRSCHVTQKLLIEAVLDCI